MYLDILQSSILNDPKLIQSNYTDRIICNQIKILSKYITIEHDPNLVQFKIDPNNLIISLIRYIFI